MKNAFSQHAFDSAIGLFSLAKDGDELIETLQDAASWLDVAQSITDGNDRENLQKALQRARAIIAKYSL